MKNLFSRCAFAVLATSLYGVSSIVVANAASTTVYPYPAGLFYSNIKSDYGAVGDGIHDDTAAFQAAAASSENNYAEQQSYTLPKTIFIPPGTYLIRDTIQWGQGYYDCCLSFRGADEATTIIKLVDNASGFDDKNNPKPLLSTRASNQSFRQFITDITVNTGAGNPGAIGVSFIANNTGAMRNVTIVSEDGDGVAGLDMSKQWPGPSIQEHITVRGFDYGVRVSAAEYGPVFENITVSGQKIAGFENRGNRVSLRNFNSTNSVTAIKNFSFQPNGALLVVKGAKLSGGASGNTAITSTNTYGSDDQLYLSGVTVSGYGTALNRDDTVTVNLPTEYYSTPPLQLFPTAAKSLNLPVEETPTPALDPNLANWVHALSYNKLADLQAAINKPNVTTIYLKGRERLIALGTLTIPANVKFILGYEAFVNTLYDYAHKYTDNTGSTLTLLINKPSGNPLVIQGLGINFAVENLANRTVVVRDVQSSTFSGLRRPGKLFLDDVVTGPLSILPGQSVWARQLNIEVRGTKITNKGGKLWILGFKTELPGTGIATSAGGSTEMLGTLMYPIEAFNAEQAAQPAFLNDNSNVSVMYGTSVYANGAYFPIQIRQIKNGVTKDILTSTQTSATTLYVGRND
jgi:hypothetical protein